MSLNRKGALLAALMLGSVFAAPVVVAADLGGNCCADLEERIAELEATTARKGNNRVSLTIEGQVNADYTYVSLDGYHDGKISQNGNDDSYLRVKGVAKVTPDIVAGYVIEFNVPDLGLGTTSAAQQPLTRQSFWFLGSKTLGSISLGKQEQATNDFDKYATNSAWIAGKPLSAGSLSDLYLTGIDLPFDGDYRNVIKYVSPELMGFTVSATWGSAVDGNSSTGSGNAYDAALRYDSKLAIADWHVMAAAGYRHSTDYQINYLNTYQIDIPTGDVDTVLLTGSVFNVPTGIFANGEFVDQKWQDANVTLRGYTVTGGVHEKWMPIGATELFGSWGRVEFDGLSAKENIDYYGLGATQALDAAAMQLYAGWRHYQTDDLIGTDVDAFNAGAVVHF